MKLNREELVAAWQSVELALSVSRLTIEANAPKISQKMGTLKELSRKIQSEIRFGDKFGWPESTVDKHEEER